MRVDGNFGGGEGVGVVAAIAIIAVIAIIAAYVVKIVIDYFID